MIRPQNVYAMVSKNPKNNQWCIGSIMVKGRGRMPAVTTTNTKENRELLKKFIETAKKAKVDYPTVSVVRFEATEYITEVPTEDDETRIIT